MFSRTVEYGYLGILPERPTVHSSPKVDHTRARTKTLPVGAIRQC